MYNCSDGRNNQGLKVALIDCQFRAGPHIIESRNPIHHVRVVTALPDVLKEQNDKIMKDWLKWQEGEDFSSAALCTYIIQERKGMAIELHNLKNIDQRLFDMFKDKGRPLE